MSKLPTESDFLVIDVESTSLNSGKLAKKDGDTYIFKPAPLVPSGVASKGQRRDLIAEYLSTSIFNELLGDKAPEIGLVLGKDGKSVYLSSKFFKDFQTLSELAPIEKEDGSGLDQTRCNPVNPILKKVSGFEKVIAACLAAGEDDIHAGNIGVVPSGDQGYEAVKIDHGRSGIENPETESGLRESLAAKFTNVKYGGMNFDVSKFRQEISSACSLEDKTVRTYIESRISDLKEVGLEAASISYFGAEKTFGEMFDPTSKPKPKVRPKRTLDSPIPTAVSVEPAPAVSPEEKARIEKGAYDKMRDYYVGGFSERKKVLKELERTLSLIEKIDMPPEWKKGDWLQDIKGQDPIEWAIDNGKTIEGKPASVWVSDRTTAASKIQKAFRAHLSKKILDPKISSRSKKPEVQKSSQLR